MWKKTYILCFNRLRFFAHQKRLNWMYYTMIFGALPLVIRLIVSFADPSGRIDHCSLSDFAFWGIMFNIAAISNATSHKEMQPSLFSSVVTLSLIQISFFVAIYCISILPDLKLLVAWFICIPLLIISIIFSYLTTDNEFMVSIRMALEEADVIEKMHPLQRAYLQQLQDRMMNGEDILHMDEAEGLREFLEPFGFDLDEKNMKIVPKKTTDKK